MIDAQHGQEAANLVPMPGGRRRLTGLHSRLPGGWKLVTSILLQGFRELGDDLVVFSPYKEHLPGIPKRPKRLSRTLHFLRLSGGQPSGRDEAASRKLAHRVPALEQVR